MSKTIAAMYNAEAEFSNYTDVLMAVMAVQRSVNHRSFTPTVSSQGALVEEVRAQMTRRGTGETRHPRAASSSGSSSSSNILAISTSTRSRTMAAGADLAGWRSWPEVVVVNVSGKQWSWNDTGSSPFVTGGYVPPMSWVPTEPQRARDPLH